MKKRREARRQRLLRNLHSQERAAHKKHTPNRQPPNNDASWSESSVQKARQDACSPARTRGDRLKIPHHALVALEVQARRYFCRCHLKRAEGISRRVLYFDPERPRAWQVIGDVAMRRKDWLQALEHFERGLRSAPEDPILWCRGAEALFRLGDFERSRRWFTKAVYTDRSTGRSAARRARSFLEHYTSTFEQARRASQAVSGGIKGVQNKLAQQGRARKCTQKKLCSDPDPASQNTTQILSEDELRAALARHSAKAVPSSCRKSGSIDNSRD